MTQFKNAMEIFKLLDKSNCRKCNEATCLAFAAAVFKGSREIGECPKLDPESIPNVNAMTEGTNAMEQESENAILNLQQAIEEVDFAETADRLGGTCTNGRLTLKVLGKDFSVDQKGKIYTDIHVHGWVAVPVLRYIVEGEGRPVSGNWVPLRELEGGKDWHRLFGQRCEKPLKKIADTYTDLFDDMVHLFAARQVDRRFDADISVVLHPLPKVPILICHWKPDEGLESDLHVFSDDTAFD